MNLIIEVLKMSFAALVSFFRNGFFRGVVHGCIFWFPTIIGLTITGFHIKMPDIFWLLLTVFQFAWMPYYVYFYVTYENLLNSRRTEAE